MLFTAANVTATGAGRELEARCAGGIVQISPQNVVKLRVQLHVFFLQVFPLFLNHAQEVLGLCVLYIAMCVCVCVCVCGCNVFGVRPTPAPPENYMHAPGSAA